MFGPSPFFTSTSESIAPASLTKKKPADQKRQKPQSPEESAPSTPVRGFQPRTPTSPLLPHTPVYPRTPVTPTYGPVYTPQRFGLGVAELPDTPTRCVLHSSSIISHSSNINSRRVLLPQIEPLDADPVSLTRQDRFSELSFEAAPDSNCSDRIPDSDSLISELFDILEDSQSSTSPSLPLTPTTTERTSSHSKVQDTGRFDCEPVKWAPDCFNSPLTPPTPNSPAPSFNQLIGDNRIGIDNSRQGSRRPGLLSRKRNPSDHGSPPARHLVSSASQSALETQLGPRKPLSRKLKNQFSTVFGDQSSSDI